MTEKGKPQRIARTPRPIWSGLIQRQIAAMPTPADTLGAAPPQYVPRPASSMNLKGNSNG